jgi:hypothetical protein
MSKAHTSKGPPPPPPPSPQSTQAQPTHTPEAYIGRGVNQATLDEAKGRLFGSDENLFCVIKGTAYKTEKRHGRDYQTQKGGLLFITSKRAMFYHSGIFGRYDQLVYPYDQISSVNCHKGIIGDELQLQVASDSVTIHGIPKGDGDIAAQNIRDLIATMKAQPLLGAAVPQVDIADQIEKLGKLREKGLISDEEFERKKSELLNRL